MDSDSELLQHFATTGDEAVFCLLVARHASMVFSVALRVTQDRAAAEEVTQTVFAILARKARALRHTSLAGWLHHCAFLEARNGRRNAARYRDALQRYHEQMNTSTSDEDAAWEEIRPQLDAALSRLPAHARHLVVLRFYERRSIPEIASATGRSEAASRKGLQRSLHRLSKVLSKRGITATDAALAAILAGQSLCAPSASAATAVTASALKAAPGITSATLLTYTIRAMNVSSHVKVAAAVLLLAAIPVAVLWNENATLRAELARVRKSPLTIPGSPSTTGARNDSLPNSGVNTPVTASAAVPGKTDPLAATAASLFGGSITKLIKDKAQQKTALEFKRLCLALPDLTEEQKAKLEKMLESQTSAAIAQLSDSLQPAALMKAFQNPAGLTEEEKTAFAKLNWIKSGSFADDPALKSILTDAQYAQYKQTREARRVSDAEDAASQTLRTVSQSIDLSAAQKDSIFQALAQRELAPADTAIEVTAPFLPGGGTTEAKDQIIRAHLTPAQEDIFDQSRAKEKESQQHIMQMFGNLKIGQPGTAGTAGK